MSKDLLYKAAYLIGQERDWSDWTHNKGVPIKFPDLGTVTVIATLTDDRGGRDEWGEYPEGSTAPAAITFKVETTDGVTAYFQKLGSYSSYGRESYTGEFVQVEAKPVSEIRYVRVR